jgi:Holliday junction resolvase
MANPSKRKGTAAETALLAWLHGNGHPEAVRNPPAGVKDVGDLRCDVPTRLRATLVIEVKNCRDVATAINLGLAELDVEMANAGTTHGVLVVKRRGKGDPGEWLAIRKVRNDPELAA